MEGEAKVGGSVAPSSRGSGLADAGWAAVAIVALLALLDIAIETWWGGSPIRLWIAVPALVLVAASVWLWWPTAETAKRWGWSGAASWSVGCVFLVLAASAWLPGGLTDGVRMLLLPTSAALTGFTTAAVLLAAVVLFRTMSALPSTPRLVARGIVAALALYALASLGLALHERAPFAALFQGGAAWQRLPRWLQGTFIGAFALLPLALLGQVIRVVDRFRRKQPIRMLLHQATALVMAIVMALSGTTLPAVTQGTGRPPAAGGEARTLPASGEAALAAAVPIEVLKAKWTGGQDPARFAEQFLTAAEAELRRPGVDPSDVGAMAAALGHDPQRIFAFLRDRVAIEPYAGMLRGARGTLAAGAGNALDRALLAQELLKASGTEGRLVTGRLSNDRTQALLDRFLTSDPLGGALASVSTAPDLAAMDAASKEVAARMGVPPEKAQEVARRAAEQAGAFWQATDAQRRAQLDFLTGQLASAGVKPAGNPAVSAQALRARLATHYWVEARDAAGAWTAFDPSFPDAQQGSSYAESPTPVNEIPREAVHRFSLSLVYNSKGNGGPKHEVLLKADVASADALFTPIAFQIQPVEPMPDAGMLAGMEAAEKVGVLKNLKRFQGIFQVGSQVTAGRAFDLEGNTYGSAPGSGPTTGAADLMSGFFGGGEADKTVQFDQLQLVLALSGPGRRPVTQTRTLLRAEDLEAADFAPPLFWSEILVQPQWIPADLAAYQMLQSVVASRGLVTDAIAASSEDRAVRIPSQSVAPYPQQLLSLALLRERAAAGILRAQAGVRALVDSPLLTMVNQQLSAMDAQAGVIRLRRTIDLVTNDVSFVGSNGSVDQAAYDVALRVGVADAALEARFLQQRYPEDTAFSGADIFERARREGRAAAVVSAGDAGALRKAGLGEADVQWIRQNEDSASRVVVAAPAAGPAAWWSVSQDGTSVLRVSGGWGQGLTEHEAIILKVIAGAYCGVEISHWAHHPTAARSWGAASCAVLTTVGVTFAFVGVHGVALGLLFTVEILNIVGTGIALDNERVHVIDLRK